MSDRHQSQPALLEVVEMKNNIDTYYEGKMALLKKGVNSYEKEAELRKSLDVYFEDKISVSTIRGVRHCWARAGLNNYILTILILVNIIII